MSLADRYFVEMCKEVLEHGTSTEGNKVRTKWEDGTPAHTKKIFGVAHRYDLSKEFPILTLRKVPIKSCVDELLWIWQKRSNKLSDLHSHIWDSWGLSDGTIGKSYGYQLSSPVRLKRDAITFEGLCKAFNGGVIPEMHAPVDFKGDKETYIPEILFRNHHTTDYRFSHLYTVRGCPVALEVDDFVYINQVDYVLYQLHNTPFSRRILTNMYNHSELADMALEPCAYSMTFNVTKDENGELVLNGILNQRSQDILTANGWNVCQYAVLLHMIARDVNMLVGTLIHVIADAHIYDRHIPLVEKLIWGEQHEAPELVLNPEKKHFYDFVPEDVGLTNYRYNEFSEKIPVAI